MGLSDDCRQIHQAAAHRVILPTTVIAACTETSQLNAVELSKKCQVQAHIALIKAGSIPKESMRQAKWPLASAYCHTNQMAAIHSITLET